MKNYFDAIDREMLRARAEQMLDYANNAKDCASRWSNFAVDRAHTFTLLDFSIAAVCLTTFGAWVGTCFSNGLRKIRGVLFAAFVASWLYVFWRILFDNSDDE